MLLWRAPEGLRWKMEVTEGLSHPVMIHSETVGSSSRILPLKPVKQQLFATIQHTHTHTLGNQLLWFYLSCTRTTTRISHHSHLKPRTWKCYSFKDCLRNVLWAAKTSFNQRGAHAAMSACFSGIFFSSSNQTIPNTVSSKTHYKINLSHWPDNDW